MNERGRYGTWSGGVDPRQIFDRPGPLLFPEVASGHLFWLQSQPADKGRVALMALSDDGRPVRVTPSPYNLRSRVHEYGGRAHVFVD